MDMPIDDGDRVGGDTGRAMSASSPGRPSLADIRRLNAKIDAFSEVFAESLQEESAGPLAGLTFAVKEVVDQAKRRTSWGTDLLRDRVPSRTAAVVSRIQQAGARCIGTTRSTVLAIAGESATRNPWDLERSPGGSSSGSAAAVAAGLVDFAIGTQTVGSIIRPASYCGVVGFKPTFGLVPTDGVMPLSVHLDHVGFLAKNVDIARRVYELFTQAPSKISAPRKILVPDLWFDEAPEPGTTRAVACVAEMFSAIGFEVCRIALPRFVIENEKAVLYGILARGVYDHHHDFIARNRDNLPAELVSLAVKGAQVDDENLREILKMRDAITAEMNDCVGDGAILLTPSTIDKPPMPGFGTGAREPQRLWTLIGWPSISLPWRRAERGTDGELPTGVQLIGKTGSDYALLELAKKLLLKGCVVGPGGLEPPTRPL